ncbi:MAG: hypothetical protein ABI855_19385 [Bacteroidota bacterium]
MRKEIATVITLLVLNFNYCFSQKNMEANYRLTGIHDMAAGFQFKNDGTFEFYYIYGASDRNAKGTYLIIGDTIKLKSDKEAGKDFTITQQSKKGSKYKVAVIEKNQYLLKHVIAVVVADEKENVFESDEIGEIEIDLKHCDKIYLQHQLFPDALTQIKDSTNNNNYFEVTLNPSLQQVSFKGIDFFIDGDNLHCLTNYFLPFENITFVKE